jgi:hypothetical protein
MQGLSMRRTGMVGATVVTLLGGCGGGGGGETTGTGSETGTPPASSSGTTGDVAPTTGSATTTADLTTGEPTTGAEVACGDTAAPAEAIAWDPGQPDISGCAVRGLRDYRAIIHVHSHHSHDACDGEPQPNGVPDEACLQDLRDALCVTRIDVAFTTDHPTHATEATIEEMLLIRGDDEPVLGAGGTPIASWMACANGHRVLVLPGVESGEMMPLGLEAHVPDAYGISSPTSFEQIKAAGALAWVAHTESRDLAELATLGLDGLEFYQLHANVDPDIREDYLGLDPAGFLTDAAPFFFGNDPVPAPDLAPLGFLLPNEPSIVALETLGQTRRLTISAGTDAHQNVLPNKAADGERIDSYRRMIRWFNNRIRLAEPLGPASAKAALRAGNSHIVFEVFGTPIGFDFHARAGEAVTEMGAEVTLAAGLTLVAELPRLDPRSPQSTDTPGLEGRLYRATAEGRSLVHSWTDGEFSIEVPGPGVYRVEVWMTPRQLAPYLGDVAVNYVEKQVPWIYSGAIFVR